MVVQNNNSVDRIGIATIVGRPNVGKSTLLNALIGQKISITSPKAQTTRHRILGVSNQGRDQILFVDTPGIFSGGKTGLDRYLAREALRSLNDVDCILMVIEALRWTEADQFVLDALRDGPTPLILVINKVDKLDDKRLLLPFIDKVSSASSFFAIVPGSARIRDNTDALLKCISTVLKPGQHLFDEDQITDRSERFLVGEIVREKLLRLLQQEVPHRLMVEIEQFTESSAMVQISAIIWVDREGHRGIVIGKQGHLLKKVGELARRDIESLLCKQVFLKTWVKVKPGWLNDQVALKHFGFDD